MSAQPEPIPLKRVTPRTRMINFVTDKFDQGMSNLEIQKAASKTFAKDQQMVKAALEFMATWAMSDSQVISRRRAVRAVLSETKGVFDAMEQYFQQVDAALISILDMTKVEILEAVAERRPIVMGELRHLNCIEEIANALPSDRSTPRSFFKTKKQQSELYNIVAQFYGEE